MGGWKAKLWNDIADGKKFILFSGPCVIESEALCDEIVSHLKSLCDELGILYVFKASFDKANRTSADSFRGPGMDLGKEILQRIGRDYDVPVLSDIHSP